MENTKLPRSVFRRIDDRTTHVADDRTRHKVDDRTQHKEDNRGIQQPSPGERTA